MRRARAAASRFPHADARRRQPPEADVPALRARLHSDEIRTPRHLCRAGSAETLVKFAEGRGAAMRQKCYGSSFSPIEVSMPLSSTESRQLEQEYLAHRPMVLAMLRAEWGGLREDHEELYQEAWTEALELRARGTAIRNIPALLRTIAWRRARDRLRDRIPEAVDPTSSLLAGLADPAPTPAEQMQVQLDAATVRDVIDALEPRQAAALKLRFDLHLDSTEIQQRLGLTPKTLERVVTDAYRRIEAHLRPTSDGHTAWTRRQRSLLLACAMGLASDRQRARAQRLLDRDPACRAMFREMRSTLEQLGVALPMPVVAADERRQLLGPVRERFADGLVTLKEHGTALASRVTGHGRSVESLGAGTAGGVGGTAVKVALACLTAAGGAAVCIEQGVFTTPTSGPTPRPHRVEHAARTPPRIRPVAATVTPLSQANANRRATATRPKAPPPPSPTASSSPPSPAPPGSTEFGPGTVGSSSANRTPASAPSAGGGEFAP